MSVLDSNVEAAYGAVRRALEAGTDLYVTVRPPDLYVLCAARDDALAGGLLPIAEAANQPGAPREMQVRRDHLELLLGPPIVEPTTATEVSQ